MAKVIKYKICTKVNVGTPGVPEWADVFADVKMGYNEANEATAKQEAYKGEYTIEEDKTYADGGLSLEERVTALEKAAPAPDEYVPGTWYYRGDTITFEGEVYVCIAPDGAVCTWSPTEYAAYWKKRG
jgi:hypothetical protein